MTIPVAVAAAGIVVIWTWDARVGSDWDRASSGAVDAAYLVLALIPVAAATAAAVAIGRRRRAAVCVALVAFTLGAVIFSAIWALGIAFSRGPFV
jgi:hypothetical protein